MRGLGSVLLLVLWTEGALTLPGYSSSGPLKLPYDLGVVIDSTEYLVCLECMKFCREPNMLRRNSLIESLELPQDYDPEEDCPEICTNHLHQHLWKELDNSLKRQYQGRAPTTRHYPWAYATALTADFIRHEIEDRHCTNLDYHHGYLSQSVPEAKVQTQHEDLYPSSDKVSSHLTPYGWIHFMSSSKSLDDLFRPRTSSVSSLSSRYLRFPGRPPAMVP